MMNIIKLMPNISFLLITLKNLIKNLTYLTPSMADYLKFKPLILTHSVLEIPETFNPIPEMVLLKILNNHLK
jgi:hypothetical protein